MLTIQIGPYANCVGSHYWDLQFQNYESQNEQNVSSYSSSATSTSSSPSVSPLPLDWSLLFRQSNKGNGIGNSSSPSSSNVIPRVIVVDFLTTFSSIPSFRKSANTTNTVRWKGNIDKSSEISSSSSSSSNDSESESSSSSSSPWYHSILPVLSPPSFYPLSPSLFSLNDVSSIADSSNHFQFFNYFQGKSLCHSHNPLPTSLSLALPSSSSSSFHQNVIDDIEDRIRYFCEEMDHFVGIQILFDCYNGWTGMAQEVLSFLKDNYRGTPIVAYGIQGIWEYNENENNIQNDQTDTLDVIRNQMGMLSEISSIPEIVEYCDLFIPMITPTLSSSYKGSEKKKRETAHYNDNHTKAAMMAAAIHSQSLSYRLRSSSLSSLSSHSNSFSSFSSPPPSSLSNYLSSTLFHSNMNILGLTVIIPHGDFMTKKKLSSFNQIFLSQNEEKTKEQKEQKDENSIPLHMRSDLCIPLHSFNHNNNHIVKYVETFLRSSQSSSSSSSSASASAFRSSAKTVRTHADEDNENDEDDDDDDMTTSKSSSSFKILTPEEWNSCEINSNIYSEAIVINGQKHIKSSSSSPSSPPANFTFSSLDKIEETLKKPLKSFTKFSLNVTENPIDIHSNCQMMVSRTDNEEKGVKGNGKEYSHAIALPFVSCTFSSSFHSTIYSHYVSLLTHLVSRHPPSWNSTLNGISKWDQDEEDGNRNRWGQQWKERVERMENVRKLYKWTK